MKTPKAKKAATRDSARGLPNVEQLGGRLAFEANKFAHQLQHITYHYGLTLPRAELIVSFYFAEARS